MKVVFLLILFIKTEKTTCKVFRNLLRCEDFRWLDYIFWISSGWVVPVKYIGDHKRRDSKSPPFYWSTGRLMMRINMIDDWSLYVINESFIHPSDKWMVCSYNHVHIFIIFIYKLPHKFPNNLKALEIRKYHRNLELIELFPGA